MKLRRAAFVTAFASGLLVACQVILGIEDDRFSFTPDGATPPTPPDAEPLDLCAHAFPPPPPTSEDSDDLPGRIVFAMNRATLRSASAATDGGPAVGYDLDNGCTCNPLDRHDGARSCVPPDASDPLCDEEGGIDNAVGAIVERIIDLQNGIQQGPTATNIDSELTRQASCGAQSILVALTRYSGLANDPEVFVSILPSFGIREGDAAAQAIVDADCPGQDPVTGMPYRPHLDRRDIWSLPQEEPAYPNAKGWVTDFQLVVDGRRLNQDYLVAFGESLLKLETATLTAKLVPLDAEGNPLQIVDGKIQSPTGNADHYRLDNVILAGRVKTDDILTGIGHNKIGGDSGLSGYFCKTLSIGLLARGYVCNAVDTVIPARQDFTDVSCNALSIAFRFSAYEAEIGKARYMPDASGCDPNYRGSCYSGDGG